MSRIGELFARKRAAKSCALIGYVTAGDPSPARTVAIARALERGGVDLIELGVPFSDPLADGPVIQLASERALKAGTTLKGVLEIAREIRKTSEMPLLLFSYLNPLMRYGFEQLAADARQAGIDGILITELSVEEAEPYLAPLRNAGLDTVFLAAPTSTPERLDKVARYSTGFVYLVSRMGVTGVREQLSSSIAPLVAAMRAKTDLPLAVGFGISRPDHARETAKLADGVVVGSAIVKVVEEFGASPELESRLEQLARDLKGGIDEAQTVKP
jgi:tryptophan synthase alpha chain